MGHDLVPSERQEPPQCEDPLAESLSSRFGRDFASVLDFEAVSREGGTLYEILRRDPQAAARVLVGVFKLDSAVATVLSAAVESSVGRDGSDELRQCAQRALGCLRLSGPSTSTLISTSRV